MSRIVYSYYVLDIIHSGHIEMMRNAKAMAGADGELIVGILTDEAVMERKPKPAMTFAQRVGVARAIKYVDLVVAQHEYSPLTNVRQIMPDILMESLSHTEDDLAEARATMAAFGGRVIVIPYFPEISSTEIKNRIKETQS